MSKIRLIFLSLFVALTLGAVVSASASAIMPAYTGIVGALKVESKKTGATNAKLEGTLAGVEILIECGLEKGVGAIENSGGSGMGESTVEVHYTMCTVVKPAGQNCLVLNELIAVLPTHDLLVLEGVPTKIRDRFTPEMGTKFASILIDSCNNVNLNMDFSVTGTATAETNNATSSLEFSSTSGENLRFGGNPATYTDTIQVLMEGGGAIKVENGV